MAAAGTGVPGAVVSRRRSTSTGPGWSSWASSTRWPSRSGTWRWSARRAKVDAGPHGVVATTTLPVPDVRCGAFALSNLGFTAASTCCSTAPRRGRGRLLRRAPGPFPLSVLSFAGGGYITGIDAAGPRVEAALEFGAQLSVNFLVAEGEVHAFGGGATSRRARDVELSGYLRLGGSLEILHLVTVRAELQDRPWRTTGTGWSVGPPSSRARPHAVVGQDRDRQREWVLAGAIRRVPRRRASSRCRPRCRTSTPPLAAVEADVTDDELAARQAYRAVVPA